MTAQNSSPQQPKDLQKATDPGGTGTLFIVSAPSGAGKTTLCRAVLDQFKKMVYSISTTTRAPRKGEENGKDYFFVSEQTFVSGIKQHKWAEWAKVMTITTGQQLIL